MYISAWPAAGHPSMVSAPAPGPPSRRLHLPTYIYLLTSTVPTYTYIHTYLCHPTPTYIYTKNKKTPPHPRGRWKLSFQSRFLTIITFTYSCILDGIQPSPPGGPRITFPWCDSPIPRVEGWGSSETTLSKESSNGIPAFKALPSGSTGSSSPRILQESQVRAWRASMIFLNKVVYLLVWTNRLSTTCIWLYNVIYTVQLLYMYVCTTCIHVCFTYIPCI